MDHPELSQDGAAARERAESLLRRACASNPFDPLPLGSLASFLWTQYKHHARHEADDLYQRALQADPTNSDTLSGYANFQWRAHECLDDAIEYYQRSIDINPGNFRTLANFSQLLFLADDRGRAKKFATTVTRSSTNDVLRLEAYFYLFAHDRSPDADQYVKDLKKLLLAGVRSPGWDLAPTVKAAESVRHSNINLLRAIAGVIGNLSEISVLEEFSAWTRN